MGRAPCCDKANVKRGPWSPEEDAKLKEFIGKYGTGGNWISLPQKADLRRCGKSCRLRWLNYLRPNIKHGEFSEEEDRIICTLYANIGSKWSIIASQLPGRTDNDIKNYWNTKLKKKLMGISNPSNQRKLFLPFQSSLQPFQSTHQSTMMPTLSQLFRDCGLFPTHVQANKAPSSLPSNYLCNTTNSSTPFINNEYYRFEMQDGLMNPGRFNNMGMFRGKNEAASCSSSDGSCSQMSFGNIKEVKQETMMSYLHQGHPSHGFEDEQKFILGYGGTSCGDIFSATGNRENPNHELLQGYDNNLEEIKQLLRISSSINNNSGSFYFHNDENKTNQRTMYFD
ncbi:hypothetical protein LIER_41819 [Lithospermum erythrorhizon]|uniref:Uncharacterized protein n=1 Tax=Lithospermum erythrorhizon TaxID=34254 RepID=A0AAV3RIX3_LITER